MKDRNKSKDEEREKQKVEGQRKRDHQGYSALVGNTAPNFTCRERKRKRKTIKKKKKKPHYWTLFSLKIDTEDNATE